MANITIGGGVSAFKDAIPSALQFTTWDEYQWFQQGGQGFNMKYQNFFYNPVYFHHVRDVENKKFFAIPQGVKDKYDYKYKEQSPHGCYKYDHQTDTSQFIQFDADDVYALRNKWDSNDNYENLVYDETTDRLFWLCYSDKTLYEIDQTTGSLTQKTSCTLGSTIQSVVATGGYLYAIDSGRNFARYDIAGDSWSSLTSMSGSASMSTSYNRLLTDGTWIVFVPYQSMAAANTELRKYNISGGTWSAASTTNAPSNTSYYISEIFNGIVYVQYIASNNNYSAIWKYNLSGNSWTPSSTLNLRSKGLTNGGAYGFFRANNKMYWIASKSELDYNDARGMQKYDLWEMDTAENFTVASDKFMPVDAGEWCYNANNGFESHLMQIQKSCERYQFFNAFHTNARGFRYIPYIDPHNKTVEWVPTPREANKEKDWLGWSAVVKNGKLYMMDAQTFDLWECTIGTWTWTKKDNLYSRIGNKMPYSCNGETWYYGCGVVYTSGVTPWQMVNGLFTVKEDSEDIFLLTPRYGSDQYVYAYKFDVSANQWSVLNASASMPNADFGNDNNNATYNRYKNHLVESTQNSSWLLLLINCYNYASSGHRTQRYYAFDPTNGTFESMTGMDSSSWSGSFGFTTEGKPVWHNSDGYGKLYYNDMDTMAYDVINKYIEQVFNNQDQYIYLSELSTTTLVFHVDPDNFEDSFAIRIGGSTTEGAVIQSWGFLKQVDSEKGGYLLGWDRKTTLSLPNKYGRILIDNDGAKSSIVTDALPDSVSDSALIFTTKTKKNFKLYLEQWCYDNDIVTFFAPSN